MEESQEVGSPTGKRKFKRMHQETCGVGRMEYDSYDDVREACERRLQDWERQGILVPWSAYRTNDWVFG